MTNSIQVEIGGIVFYLKTDEDPDYVRELADLVTAKIYEVKRDSGASAVECATIAALDFADRYLKENRKKKPAKKKPAEDKPKVTELTLITE